MSNTTLNSRLIVKNDTRANWNSSSLVLLKGEIAYEADTGLFKIGDGVNTFSAITKYYAGITSGTTAPTAAKAGVAGEVYLNTTTNKAYRCFGGTTGNYIWKQIVDADDLANITSHPTITVVSDTSNSVSPSSGGNFTAVDSVTRDANGHVTKINLKTINLPIDPNTITRIAYANTAASVNLGSSLASGDIYIGNAAQKVAISSIPSSPTPDEQAALPTTIAVKNYVDSILSTANAMVYKGIIAGGSTGDYGALTPAADSGHVYIVSVAGKINGINVESGDMLICMADSTAAATSSTYTTVAANWNIIQVNLIGAVIGPSSSVDGNIAVFDGVSGKLIKDSGKAASTLLVSTDTYILNGGNSAGW